MKLTYAIGDIHGHFYCLNKLFNKIKEDIKKFDVSENNVTLVTLGDYIDRGYKNIEVIDFLIDIPKKYQYKVINLMGNHEDFMVLGYENQMDLGLWLMNGGDSTYDEYEKSPQKKEEHLKWIKNLNQFYDDGKRFFVHAGVNPDLPLNEQTEEDLKWIREPFLNSFKDFGRLIVHGHTPSSEPVVKNNRIGIDTCAFRTNNLTAVRFINDELTPYFIQTKEE